MNLYIYKYNNYYNRMVKQEDTLAGYGVYIHVITNCKDFTPNDGVNTQHIFGSAANNYDGSGDYAIVTDENNNILFRWFIIETQFTRQGQWLITMRRDLVVDYYDSIIDAPCFIEKATLPVDNPFIYSKENITVNQIKTNETLLKDKSGCAWIVGYYNKDAGDLTGTVPVNTPDSLPVININMDIENWDFYKYQTQDFIAYPTTGSYVIKACRTDVGPAGGILIDYSTDINSNGETAMNSLGSTSNWGLYQWTNYPERDLQTAYQNYGMDRLRSFIPATLEGKDHIASQEDTNYLYYELNGSLIQANGRFFSLEIIDGGEYTETVQAPLNNNLYLAMKEIATNADFEQTNQNKTGFYNYRFTTRKCRIALHEQYELETTYNIPQENKLITTDAPWNIFAIPYGDNLTIKDNLGNTILEKTDSTISLTTAMAMQKKETNLTIYDMQLLPYCPIKGLISAENEITVTNSNQYSLIKTGGENPQTLGIIFNIPQSRFETNLEYSIPEATISIKKKLGNECDKWRISSPNYSNYFDFSAEMNGGVRFFNADCEYKPFTPYIHINPDFGGLYGQDWNDPRGLVLGGDFSLSQIVDQWETYQIQNKNFQNIFDRQIQNLTLTQDIQRKQEAWGVAAGVGQGAAAGALAGSFAGPWGMAIGAAAGSITSAVGGAYDIKYNEQLRTEALDYTKDQFGFQIGNIQALPNTISKVSAFNNNNKVFPVLEYYTCKDEEKIAFVNKVAWNGMTVMAIGNISKYKDNTWSYTINNETITSKGYIKGKIIRIEDIEDEFHLLKEISNEIYKGVYF